jgi:hypothetical protein
MRSACEVAKAGGEVTVSSRRGGPDRVEAVEEGAGHGDEVRVGLVLLH